MKKDEGEEAMVDLCAWLDEAEGIGQPMNVDGVHWDIDLSTLTEFINERSKNRPALVFDRIQDHPRGYPVAAYPGRHVVVVDVDITNSEEFVSAQHPLGPRAVDQNSPACPKLIVLPSS